ncbi:MAG: hypothetical protein KatS3mg005_3277 [Bryobacteraceae bacterium]|jgi:hypothetical protein|nr:MAG: hypothetical protein KatS3mg005_3277 [Bryobacteraceae bacterium]
MKLSDAFLAQGEQGFQDLLRRVSISRLRTYQLYEPLKVRTHLHKLNSETLRKAAPRLWERLQQHDEDLASDLAQAVLIGHLDMIIAALDFLGVPHQDGFFAKDADVSSYLTEGWQQRAYEALKDRFPANVLEFYLNHLGIETGRAQEIFRP